ncbi:MAG: O-antigen ligase family protein [Pseudomonadota bacterium]
MRLKQSINFYNLLCRISLLMAAVLYFVWPLPHTMALRYLLLIVTASAGTIIYLSHAKPLKTIQEPWFLFFVALLCWGIFHAAFLSSNGAEAWSELRGEWFKAYLAMFGGIGCALASRNIKESTFNFFFIVVLVAQPVLFLLLGAIKSLQQGHMALNYWGLVDHKMSLAFFSHLMVSFSCAKLLDAMKFPINVSTYMWLFFIALGFYIAVTTNTRNSIVLLSILCAMTAMFIIYRTRLNAPMITRAGLLTVLTVAIVSGVFFSSKTNGSWRNFGSDIKIAMQTEAYPNWINRAKYGLPKNENGVEVSDSNYARIAFAVAGLEMVLQHPLGYGITRHAFENLVKIEHPDADIANSHNGYIDFVASVGFPGLILLLGGVFFALKQIRESSSVWSRPAIWIITTIMFNWVLDPVSREHYFETLLFMVGLFSTLSLQTSQAKSGVRQTHL